MAHSTPGSSPLTSPRAEGQFVGRHEEMRELRAALAAARAGQGSIFLLVGELGIGKSRTAQELATHAAQEDVLVL